MRKEKKHQPKDFVNFFTFLAEQNSFWDLVVTLQLKSQPEPEVVKIPFQVRLLLL